MSDCAHVQDNQGLCHNCGVLLDRSLWELYAGKGALAPSEVRAAATKAEREKTMRGVLRLLRSPIALTCLPDREAALTVVKAHGVTVEELIEFAVAENWRNA